MTAFLDVHPGQARLFLKYITRVMHRQVEKDDAKETLVERIEDLKHFLRSRGFKKNDMLKQLDGLKGELDSAVEKGSKVTKYTIDMKEGMAPFYKKLDQLEIAIDRYLDSFHKREDRVHELEKEIITEASNKHRTHIARLKQLEQKFMEIQNLNHFDIDRLNSIRVKIEFLKNKARMKT